MLVTEWAWVGVARVLEEGDLAVDGTVGNGVDTLFLAECVGATGTVVGFDLQEEAIRIARGRLEAAGVAERCRLFRESHAGLRERMEAEFPGRRAKAIMFNLGYLPGGDKTVTTRVESTLAALEGALGVLAPGGLMSVVLYPGHAEGKREAEAVLAWAERLADPFGAIHSRWANRSERAPQLLNVEVRS